MKKALTKKVNLLLIVVIAVLSVPFDLVGTVNHHGESQ